MMGTPETENQTYMPEFEFHNTQDCPKPSPYNWTPIGCYNIMMQYEDFEDDENDLESWISIPVTILILDSAIDQSRQYM